MHGWFYRTFPASYNNNLLSMFKIHFNYQGLPFIHVRRLLLLVLWIPTILNQNLVVYLLFTMKLLQFYQMVYMILVFQVSYYKAGNSHLFRHYWINPLHLILFPLVVKTFLYSFKPWDLHTVQQHHDSLTFPSQFTDPILVEDNINFTLPILDCCKMEWSDFAAKTRMALCK